MAEGQFDPDSYGRTLKLTDNQRRLGTDIYASQPDMPTTSTLPPWLAQAYKEAKGLHGSGTAAAGAILKRDGKAPSADLEKQYPGVFGKKDSFTPIAKDKLAPMGAVMPIGQSANSASTPSKPVYEQNVDTKLQDKNLQEERSDLERIAKAKAKADAPFDVSKHLQSNWKTYAGGGALLGGLAALYFATRKRKGAKTAAERSGKMQAGPPPAAALPENVTDSYGMPLNVKDRAIAANQKLDPAYVAEERGRAASGFGGQKGQSGLTPELSRMETIQSDGLRHQGAPGKSTDRTISPAEWAQEANPTVMGHLRNNWKTYAAGGAGAAAVLAGVILYNSLKSKKKISGGA